MEKLYPNPRTNESNSFSSMHEELSFNDFVWHEVLKDVHQLNDESIELLVENNLEVHEEVVDTHLDRSETDKSVSEDPIKENATEINLNYLCIHDQNVLQEEDVNISDLCISKEKTISNLYNQEEDGHCDKNESLLENDKPWLQWGECGTDDELLNAVFNLPDQLGDTEDVVVTEEDGKDEEKNGTQLKILGIDEINDSYCKENIVINEDMEIPKKKGKKKSKKKRKKVSSSRKESVSKDDLEREGVKKSKRVKSSKRNKKKSKKGGLRVSGDLFSQKVKHSSTKETPKVEEESKVFKCNTCERIFNRSGDLKVHERLHTGKQQFTCGWCGKEFLRSSFLKNHEAIHMGSTPFKCKLCPKEFSHSSYLKKHEWLHTGVKPFKCDMCEKEFSSRANLEVHKRVHTGEKPFKCNFCDKSFAQSYTRKIHERLHTGEKHLKCSFCPKTFNYSGNLKTHEKGHAEELIKNSKMCVRVITIDGLVEVFQ